MTVTLGSVLTHFGLRWYLDSLPGASGYWKARLDRALYVRLADGYFTLIHSGYYSGTAAPLNALAQALSGHKVYVQSNGQYTKLLDLTGKRVVNDQ
jgi:hypothetical protein